ncbi:MAG TPA: prolyl oligopeptidase family serine peptidase [Kofleriaceae bacterium]|nr:prolyl oligopeptidase family serine peptidase [Kofleriaceae bacterium]
MRSLCLVAVAACCPPMSDKPKTPAVVPTATAPVATPTSAPLAPPAVVATPAGPPIARVVDEVDKQFGLEVADPYRWMEGGENAERTAWLKAQGEYAAKQLAALPMRDKLYARIKELGSGVTAVFDVQLGGKRIFHNVFPANAQLAKLAVREPDGTTRILVDPEQLSTAEEHVSLNAYSASPDGTLVAYVISKGGGEVGVLHIMDVKTGKDLPDQIERIWGEGAASWLPDGKRFFYTQLAVPQPGVDPMTNQVARLHVLGKPADSDVTILGRNADATWKLAPEEWPGVWVPPGSQWAIATAGGARSEMRVAVAKVSELDMTGTSKTPWKQVADYSDGVESAIPHGDRLYMKTYKDAPNRKVVSVPLAKPDLKTAKVEIAEDANASLVATYGARDALYLLHMEKGLARVSRWAWQGKASPITLPYAGWAPDLATDLSLDGITFQIEGWLKPGEYFRYDIKKKVLVPAGLASSSTADVSQIIADEVEATNPDGTKVPLSILHRKDAQLDGSHPTILYAYGGYGSSQTPGFSATRIAWIERGGVYAIAHVRGGGEKGRRWQDDGSREKKMNGVRDFIACAEYLIAEKYTSPQKLAVNGVSMGGVLVGRAITERPDLFAAAQLAVGIVNPLRILAAENGANQKGELGDPATEAGYRSILEMDPYAHVKAHTAYPAVLFTIGLNDHRVAPWMTTKMAARLLTSTTSKRPIWIRVDAQAGHGIGSTREQAFAERADAWSFFLAQMGE